MKRNIPWCVASCLYVWLVRSSLINFHACSYQHCHKYEYKSNLLSSYRAPVLGTVINPFFPTVAFSQPSSNMCCPRDCVSRTAHVGTLGKNGLKSRWQLGACFSTTLWLTDFTHYAKYDSNQKNKFKQKEETIK